MLKFIKKRRQAKEDMIDHILTEEDRDYFAGVALNAIVIAETAKLAIQDPLNFKNVENREKIVQYAYSLADAMIIERERRNRNYDY